MPMKILGVGIVVICKADVQSAAQSAMEQSGEVVATTTIETPPSMREDLQLLGSEASAPIQRMLRWLESGGATWRPGLRIRSFSAYERGLVALQPVPSLRNGLIDIPTN